MKNTFYYPENFGIDSAKMTSPNMFTSHLILYHICHPTFILDFFYKMTAIILPRNLSASTSLPSIFILPEYDHVILYWHLSAHKVPAYYIPVLFELTLLPVYCPLNT